ncbi:uncharacterized protein FIBRA_07826 [Fibroporia radiculosa]|uniref:NAD-dependent epimerase/dehydratase domain-containing protein n=1 Tax=Fibroporia radiculosa TaxID=599839 RepID=J4GFN3_9APHY|nr:uncharacterized protein FIBRA_07826 [Fibroporia radiculosa]CCM05598.1 predicted protein [Fibroporia radiculosa]
MPVLAPNSLVVITGITGYIGSHIGIVALQAGHRVRGTVRSLARSQDVRNVYAAHGVDVSKLTFALVDDLASEAQLAAALEDADGIIHVALAGGVPSIDDKAPQDAVNAARAILQVAARLSSVKRIVFTSSSSAAYLPIPGFMEDHMTDETWCDSAIEYFQHPPGGGKGDELWEATRYNATKALSERAAWAWVAENKPAFEISTVLPNACFGPVLMGAPRSTAAWIAAILSNQAAFTQRYPPDWFVDVRDVARLHVLALTEPELSGRRLWATAAPFGWNEMFAIFRKHFPQVQVPEDIPGVQGEPAKFTIENEVGRKALGEWTSLEKSIVDTAKSIGY